MQNPSAPRIVLASSSSYRRGLLDRFLSDYEAESPDVDEASWPDLPPEELAPLLARKKAEAVSSKYRNALVIGADQLAVLDDQVLGKPGDHQHAVEQLLAASGKAVRFLTAVCLLDPVTRKRYEHVDTTTVRFRNFDRRLAETYLRHFKCSKADAGDKAIAMLEAVKIRDPKRVYDLYPHEISGGMGQRVMIAMMLLADPDLVIADEPTSALDVTVRLQVLNILDSLVRDRGIGLIMISHDLNLVRNFCDRVLIMYAGRIVETLAAADLDNAQHPYTRGLLAAQPRIGGGPQRDARKYPDEIPAHRSDDEHEQRKLGQRQDLPSSHHRLGHEPGIARRHVHDDAGRHVLGELVEERPARVGSGWHVGGG